MYLGDYEKQESQPTPHHCVSVCLTLKEESKDINGVMIKKTQWLSGSMFECWCIQKAGKAHSESKSEYKSCKVNLKCKY